MADVPCSASLPKKHIYDGLLSSPAQTKRNESAFSMRIDDYREIFSPSKASLGHSIPTLDLPAVDQSDSSIVDYAGVFGGFGDDNRVEISAGELFRKSKRKSKRNSQSSRSSTQTKIKATKSRDLSCNPGNTQTSTSPAQIEIPPSTSQELCGGSNNIGTSTSVPSHQPCDVVKDFDDSHEKTNQSSNDSTYGTTNTGCLDKIDEVGPTREAKLGDAKRQGKSTKAVSDLSTDKHPSEDKCYTFDASYSTPDYFGRASSKSSKSLTSNQQSSVAVDSSPLLNEELDVNSAAAVSAAAMKRAIEEAEAKIRSAREILKGKEIDGSGRLSFKASFKGNATSETSHSYGACGVKRNDSLKVEATMQNESVNEDKLLKKEDLKIKDTSVELEGKTYSHEVLISAEKIHKHEGVGEWEATKHISQLLTGVKNRLVGFISKQADAEKTVLQEDEPSSGGGSKEQVERSTYQVQNVDAHISAADEDNLENEVEMNGFVSSEVGESAHTSNRVSIEIHKLEENDVKRSVALEQSKVEEELDKVEVQEEGQMDSNEVEATYQTRRYDLKERNCEENNETEEHVQDQGAVEEEVYESFDDEDGNWRQEEGCSCVETEVPKDCEKKLQDIGMEEDILKERVLDTELCTGEWNETFEFQDVKGKATVGLIEVVDDTPELDADNASEHVACADNVCEHEEPLLLSKNKEACLYVKRSQNARLVESSSGVEGRMANLATSPIEQKVNDDQLNIEPKVNGEQPIIEPKVNVEQLITEPKLNGEQLIIEPKANVEQLIIEPKVNVEKSIIEPKANVEKPIIEPKVNVEKSIIEPKANAEKPIIEPKVNDGQPIIEPKVNDEHPIIEPKVNDEYRNIKPMGNDEHSNIEPKVTDEQPIIETKVNEEQPIIEIRVNDEKPNFEPKVTDEQPIIEPKADDEHPVIEPKVDDEQPIIESKVDDEQPIIVPKVNNEQPFIEPKVYDEHPNIEHKVTNDQPIIEPKVNDEQPIIEPKVNDEQLISEPKVNDDQLIIEPKVNVEQPIRLEAANQLVKEDITAQPRCSLEVADNYMEHENIFHAVDDLCKQGEKSSLSRTEASGCDDGNQYFQDVDFTFEKEGTTESTSTTFETKVNLEHPRFMHTINELIGKEMSEPTWSSIEVINWTMDHDECPPQADDVDMQEDHSYLDSKGEDYGHNDSNQCDQRVKYSFEGTHEVPSHANILKAQQETDLNFEQTHVDEETFTTDIVGLENQVDESLFRTDMGEVDMASDEDKTVYNVETSNKRKRCFEKDEMKVFYQPDILLGDEIYQEVDERVEIHVDETVGESGECTSVRRDGACSGLEDGHSTKLTQRRRRWFQNRGEEVIYKPSVFYVAGMTIEMDDEIAQISELDNSLQDCVDNLVNDQVESSTSSAEAAPRRRRWFENGEKSRPAQRPSILVDKTHDQLNNKVRQKEKEIVDRAIRAARLRAFVEARQKASAAAQVKQRKASSEIKIGASMDAKLRAEHIAVERATVEARERAMQKAISEKAASESRGKDPENQTSGPSHSKGYPSEKSSGAACESPQGRKAKSERNKRTMERAAKALEEKNSRDFIAQKEQAERDMFADVLDSEVKMWLTGKDGNLRALLSTLQYILGPDSSWQPIPLADLVDPTSVRKAYKRAALCVHPDKLQQRGATIQQKYICEKVFDLLKEAWKWHQLLPDDI